MGLIETASGNSVWMGMDYYNDKKVISYKKTSDTTYEGVVAGSDAKLYGVNIDKEHPKRSTCTCSFAAGRRVVCKHMIALYFTAEPEAAEEFLKKVEEWEEEEEEEALSPEEEKKQIEYSRLVLYVKSLSKEDLHRELMDSLQELDDLRNKNW